MLRVLGIPAILITLFLGGYLSTQQMRSKGRVDFSRAVPVLRAYFEQNRTYVGATLPPGSGVVLASADATSYCLQAGNEHEVGPGGKPQPGPC